MRHKKRWIRVVLKPSSVEPVKQTVWICETLHSDLSEAACGYVKSCLCICQKLNINLCKASSGFIRSCMWIGPPNPPFKYSSSAFHFVMPLKFYNYHLGVILEIGYAFIFSSSCMYNFTLRVKFIFGPLFIVIQVFFFTLF